MSRATAATAERIELADPFAVQEEFWARGWTDGLPIVPPMPELVQAFLTYSGLEAADAVGELRERGRVVTAEKVAINAVMAGCLPEYFPVVLAAWQCLMTPEWNLNATALSTSGPAPLTIVNGPLAPRLSMRSGGNLFGPGSRANATIGRAIRLLLINVAGATGPLDRACIGHPGKYSYCIAEDEDETWTPLHVQRGFGPDESAVTVVNLEAPQYIREPYAKTPEELLDNFASHVRSWNQGGASLIVINPEHRGVLQGAGWSKEDVSRYLYERLCPEFEARSERRAGDPRFRDQGTIYEPRGPEDFLIVGGGAAGIFSAAIPPSGVRTDVVSRAIPDMGCAGACLI